MKKIGLCALLSLVAITAGAWGLDRTFVSQPFFDGYDIKDQPDYTSSALYAVVRGGKKNFTACINEYASKNSFNDNNQRNHFSLLEQTIGSWIGQVRKQIEASGRASEFADVLAWLPSQITFTPASCDKADIWVKMGSSRQADRKVWAYDPTRHNWQLLFPYGKDSSAEVWKESGAFWGLGVLTDIFEPQTVEEGHFKNTTDERYSLYSVAQSHPAPGTSVMWWKESTASSISCDDVEGFINAVDFIQFMEGETSNRLENGWKSLCGHPYYYLRGRATVSREGLDSLRQETTQYREEGKTLHVVQQLLNQWKGYQQKKVVPVLNRYSDLLAQQPRPLDDNGLMLSAQVNHLEQVSRCVDNATNRIGFYATELHRCAGTDCPALRAELAQLDCSVDLEPLQTPGLEQSTPLPHDYPTGKMHTCAVCGKPIEVGAAHYDEVYTRNKKQTKYYRYYRHTTCPAATVDQARAYHDHATPVQAPTYAQLQVRSSLAENLPPAKRESTGAGISTKSRLVTPIEIKPFKPAVSPLISYTPNTSTPVKGVSTKTTANTPVVSAKPATTAVPAKPVVHEHSRAVGTVLPGETVHCSVCGEEIHEGETYYKRTESQFIHRHGQCAYSFFAKKYNVDENALATYARTYSFGTSDEVASARADMEALGLSVDSVRQFRAQKEEASSQQVQQKSVSTNLEAQCRVYLKVTAQDVKRFKAQYGKQLKHIADKLKQNHKLTKRQTRLHQYYEQLLKNEKTTQECLALEQASR